MPSSSGEQNERYLPTGWRVVGAGADRIVERAAKYAGERLEAGIAADTLYALQCTMPPGVRGRPSVERILDDVTAEVRRTWPECPRLLRDTPVTRAPSRFGGLRFETLATPGREWVGEVVWRAVHPVVPGAPITTHVVLEERASYTRLSVRVTADNGLPSVRGYVGAGQAQPAFVKALRPDVTPVWMGAPLAVRTIDAVEVDDFVLSVLESDARELPVAVLAPLEDGEFVVVPDDLAWDLLGRAQLYVIRDHRITYRLSDAVGDRRMSSYWGAVRAYMPGWSRHDDPLDHPLLVADRLADPVIRATWLGELGVFTGPQLVLPEPIADRLDVERASEQGASLQVVRTTTATRTRQGVGVHDADPSDRVAKGEAGEADEDADAVARTRQNAQPDWSPLLRTVVDEVRALGSMLRQLNDEVERLRTISSVRSSSTSAIERRLGRLEDILERVFPDDLVAPVPAGAADADTFGDPDSGAEEERGPALAQVVQDAAESWSDALHFLDSAYVSAADSPYEDPERVRAIFEAMARVARHRRDGTLGTSLRDAFGDLGIDYRAAIARSTSARLREQYRFLYRDGELVEAEEHIVLGNTYDPRRCLRIYFSSRVPNEPRFVIAHVGRHFEVKSSS